MGTFDIWHELNHHLKIYMMGKYSNSYRLIKVIWKNQSVDKIEYKKRTYVKNMDLATFTKWNNPALYYDIDEPLPLALVKDKSKDIKGSAHELHNLINDESEGNVLNEGKDKRMMLIVVGCVVSILVVAGVALYFHNEQSKELANMAVRLAEVYANSTKTNGGVVVIP